MPTVFVLFSALTTVLRLEPIPAVRLFPGETAAVDLTSPHQAAVPSHQAAVPSHQAAVPRILSVGADGEASPFFLTAVGPRGVFVRVAGGVEVRADSPGLHLVEVTVRNAAAESARAIWPILVEPSPARRVRFRYFGAEEAANVSVLGDWNGWLPTPLADDDFDGVWTVDLELMPGRHRYLFLVDGLRLVDPTNPERETARTPAAPGGESVSVAVLEPPPAPPRLTGDKLERDRAVLSFVPGGSGAGLAEAVAIGDAGRRLGIERQGRGLTVAWGETPPEVVRVFARDADGRFADFAFVPRLDPVEEAPWYVLLLDRFANGDATNDPADTAFAGGDLAGVLARLEDGYLEALGVRTIVLSPLAPALEYAGRRPTASVGIAPRYGTETDLVRLVSRAHARNTRVVLDLVLAGVSPDNPVYEQHPAWFHGLPPDETGTDFVPFDFDNPQAVAFVRRVMRHWIERFDLDGVRLVNASELPPGLVAALRRDAARIEAARGRKVLLVRDDEVGTIPVEGAGWFAAPGRKATGSFDAPRLATRIEGETFLRNPATYDALAARFALLYTRDEPPVLFYGDERGMAGGAPPDNHRPIPWEETLGYGEKAVLVRVARLAAARQAFPVLGAETRRVLETPPGVAAAVISRFGRFAVVAARIEPASGGPHTGGPHTGESNVPARDLLLDVAPEIPDGTTLRDLLAGGSVRVTGGRIRLNLGPHEAVVLVAE